MTVKFQWDTPFAIIDIEDELLPTDLGRYVDISHDGQYVSVVTSETITVYRDQNGDGTYVLIKTIPFYDKAAYSNSGATIENINGGLINTYSGSLSSDLNLYIEKNSSPVNNYEIVNAEEGWQEALDFSHSYRNINGNYSECLVVLSDTLISFSRESKDSNYYASAWQEDLHTYDMEFDWPDRISVAITDSGNWRLCCTVYSPDAPNAYVYVLENVGGISGSSAWQTMGTQIEYGNTNVEKGVLNNDGTRLLVLLQQGGANPAAMEFEYDEDLGDWATVPNDSGFAFGSRSISGDFEGDDVKGIQWAAITKTRPAEVFIYKALVVPTLPDDPICMQKQFQRVWNPPVTNANNVLVTVKVPIYRRICESVETSVWTYNTQGIVIPPCDSSTINLESDCSGYNAAFGLPNNTSSSSVIICRNELQGYKTEQQTRTIYTTTPGYYTTNPNIGWNSGSISSIPIRSGQSFLFNPVLSSVGVIVGITTRASDIDEGYQTIKHGIYCHSGLCEVIESGQVVGPLQSFEQDDTFAIVRTPTGISYQVGNVEWYSTVVSLPEDLIIDLSMYAGGDRLCNARIEAFVTIDGLSSHGEGALLSYLTIDGTSYLSTVSEGTSEVKGAFAQSVIGDMVPFISRSSDYAYNDISVSMQPFNSILGQDLLSNETALAVSTQLGFGAEVRVLSGTLIQGNVSMKSFDAIGSDYLYAEVDAFMVPMETLGGQYIQVDSSAFLIAPVRYIEASGSVSSSANGAVLIAPAVGLLAFTGAVTEFPLEVPPISMNAEGSVANIGRVEIQVPKLTVEAFLNPGVAGSGTLIYRGIPKIDAYSGALTPIDLRVPPRSIVAEATVVEIGEANLLVPRRYIDAQAIVKELNVGILPVPEADMLSGIFNESWGRYSVQAHGFQALVESLDAFVMNTTNNALSKYDVYGFNNIVRVKYKNYGVTDTGIYLLEGDLDLDKPIEAEFSMHPTNYDTLQTKNIAWAYISARSEDQFVVEAEADEREYSGKVTMSHGRKNLYNWRVQFGKGVKACNWGFTIRNKDGGDFQIQSFDSEPFEHKRKV